MTKRQNGDCNVSNFSVVWSWCTGIQSLRFYKWLSILNWSKWIFVVDILTQILLTLLTLNALPILRKISICCRWFLFGVSYHVNLQLIPWRVINRKQCGQQTKFALECLLLTAHNWQKWKRVFLTCPCHEIYRDEAEGLKSCKYTWKITIYVNVWNFGQFREIWYFVNNCLMEVQI